MKNSKVSVCIPTYNGERFLKATLDSIINQSYDNIEIIVTDDCSSDGTIKLITDKYPNVNVSVNEKRLGLTGNWERSVSKATGEYIKLMGQDDVLDPDAIRLQVESLENNPGSALSIGQTNVINEYGRVLMTRRLSRKNFCSDGRKFARRSLWCRNIYCEPSNVLYRSDIKIPYDSNFKYVPDWDHNIALALHGNVCYVAHTIMSFRVSSSSETSRLHKSNTQTINNEAYDLMDKYRSTLDIPFFQVAVFRMATITRSMLRNLFLKFQVTE